MVAINVLEAVEAVLAAAPDALYVASLGTPTAALREVSDDGPHVYMGGAMGSALATALGLAEAQPRHGVVAVLGDGELLMSANTLWSLAALAPDNLLAIVLNDGLYYITGGQRLGPPTVFAEVAAALPALTGTTVSSATELTEAVTGVARPALIVARIQDQVKPRPSPFVDPARVRLRFADRLDRG